MCFQGCLASLLWLVHHSILSVGEWACAEKPPNLPHLHQGAPHHVYVCVWYRQPKVLLWVWKSVMCSCRVGDFANQHIKKKYYYYIFKQLLFLKKINIQVLWRSDSYHVLMLTHDAHAGCLSCSLPPDILCGPWGGQLRYVCKFSLILLVCSYQCISCLRMAIDFLNEKRKGTIQISRVLSRRF